MSVALAFTVLAAAGVYAFDLWRRPMKSCRWCKGTGRVAGSTRKRWGWCEACHEKNGKAKPPRPRLGARLVRPELRRKK